MKKLIYLNNIRFNIRLICGRRWLRNNIFVDAVSFLIIFCLTIQCWRIATTASQVYSRFVEQVVDIVRFEKPVILDTEYFKAKCYNILIISYFGLVNVQIH